MSTRFFQGTIYQMAEAVNRTIGVIDDNSEIVACSDLPRIGTTIKLKKIDDKRLNFATVIDGFTYKSFGNSRQDFVVFVKGDDAEAKTIVDLLSVSLAQIKQFYDEKFDKENFIKNVILDNILPGDIFIKARELRFNSETSRVCMLIKNVSSTEISTYEVVQTLFPDRSKDFVINLNETDVVLVKEVKRDIKTKDLEKLAASITDTLSSEFYARCVIGIGTIVIGVKHLALSFKEAQVAIEVGKVFETERNIMTYEKLGIARLIYQLPTTLCEMFLHEVFNSGTIESLDQETLFTIQKFFENNLNVSETSRKLFVHRNTLVYRLEKIKKITGLDLREFEDAIVFKVALMVKKYLTANPTKY